MAGESKTIAREGGVSTLKPGAAPNGETDSSESTREPQISRTTRQERTADRLTASGAGRAPEGTQRATEIADESLAQEQGQLERHEEKLGEKIEDAKLKGDAKAVRTLQSQLDLVRTQLSTVEGERDQWPAWIVQMAQQGKTPKEMVEAVRQAQAAKQARAALTQRSEPDEIIATLIDSDDPEDLEFARFLRKRVKADIPVTRKNLAFHREEFEERRTTTGAAATVTTATKTGNGVKKPPKVAGAGGGDLGGEKTGWQSGVSTTELLTRGFAEQDRARRH
jgi:hypothetical protein